MPKKTKVKPDEELQEIIADPLDDAEIRHYLPDVKILKYSELSKYNSITKLLPQETDYCIILYEDSYNTGHWCCLSRYMDKKDTIEFFDPYGYMFDKQLEWTPLETRRKLGASRKILTMLLNCCTQKVVWNPIAYQKDGSSINNCGRHCVYRIFCMLKGMNLDQYFRHMKELEKSTGMDADSIVSSQIDIT